MKIHIRKIDYWVDYFVTNELSAQYQGCIQLSDSEFSHPFEISLKHRAVFCILFYVLFWVDCALALIIKLFEYHKAAFRKKCVFSVLSTLSIADLSCKKDRVQWRDELFRMTPCYGTFVCTDNISSHIQMKIRQWIDLSKFQWVDSLKTLEFSQTLFIISFLSTLLSLPNLQVLSSPPSRRQVLSLFCPSSSLFSRLSSLFPFWDSRAR